MGVQKSIVNAAVVAENAVSQLEAFSQRIRDLSNTLTEGLIGGVFRADG